MQQVLKILYLFLDILGFLFSISTAWIASLQARLGPQRLPLTFRAWDFARVTPVRHHYYTPVFNAKELKSEAWTRKDPLCGIDFNVGGQLGLLKQFRYNAELEAIPVGKPVDKLGFYHNNVSFGPGDAETLYNVVRHFKPKMVIEIGSGYSTRMMKMAIDKNCEEGVGCTLTCIEPYEMPWLESMGLDRVIREKVEDIGLSLFSELSANDIIFIDSSHVLRTGGDVFHEYLHILPNLQKGVVVHIHDIFIPFEYPREWVVDKKWFWTEQYLLQAFLAFNSEFEIILAVNYLSREHREDFSEKCPVYSKYPSGCGSFWIRRK